MFPFFEGVDFAPFFCDTAVRCDLGEEGEREGDRAEDVGWLAGVVGEELGEVVEGPELRFGGGFKDGKFLRGRIYVTETFTGRR